MDDDTLQIMRRVRNLGSDPESKQSAEEHNVAMVKMARKYPGVASLEGNGQSAGCSQRNFLGSYLRQRWAG